MANSPTSRSLAMLRRDGCVAAVVEKWIPQAGIRRDLFGVIDIVALDAFQGVLGIQACAAASCSARVKKALAEPRLRLWLARGNRFEVWAWSKAGARGKVKRWTCRKVVFPQHGIHPRVRRRQQAAEVKSLLG